MTIRCAVTGITGQVARSLAERASHRRGIEVILLGRPRLDLAVTRHIEQELTATAPDVIVSAAAYTAVDKAETDPVNAFAINASAPEKVGKMAKKLGVPVIHLSTDYIFDGQKQGSYQENDPAAPINIYGRSKLEGEQRLAESGAEHVILRTAWVYSPFGTNFLKTMLRLAGDCEEINVVADQTGNPTSALDIADAVLEIAHRLLISSDPDLRGIFHMAAQGDANWAEFAAAIFEASQVAGGPFANVRPIAARDYPVAARRPPNSRLDCSKLAATYQLQLPHWRSSVNAVTKRLVSAQARTRRAVA